MLRLPKLLLLLITIGLCACAANDAKQTVNYEENVVEIPEDFPAFYSKFHIDPEYQLSHIIFPLAGKSQTEMWNKEDWTIHQPFSDADNFNRDIQNFGGIITETIVDKNGLFYIVRRFSKINSEWNLIHYEQGTKLDGFEEVDSDSLSN